MSKNYILAVFTLMGTIIGVGLFAIPYVVNKSGVLSLLILMPALAVIQYYLHLLFAEVVLSTRGDHRIPGFVERYGGKLGKNITLVMAFLSDYGILMAYVIVGGLFLHQLLSPFMGYNLLFYTIVLFSFEAVIVFFGIRTIASLELVMTILLVLIVFLIGWRGWQFFSLNNFHLITWRYALMPYGPIFFSLIGGAAIPTVCKLLDKEKHKIKSAIAWGTFMPALVMLAFILIILGITGSAITPDTLAGLSLVIKDGVIGLALIFGLIAIITSFIVIAQALREVFWWDYKINKYLAWVLACLPPMIFYILGLRDLTKIVGLTGAMAGGMIGIILLWLVLVIKKKAEKKSVINNKINLPIALSLSLLFILGLVYEIWAVIK